MSATFLFRRAVEADLPLVRSLAERVWSACFPAFITGEQIDYMLDWMYSPETLRRELREGVTWELACLEGRPVGYLSCTLEAAAGRMKLNKLYLLPEFHGRGLGRRMIERALETARDAGARTVHLQVNRGNAPAIRAYERAGFRVVRSVVSDIGRGFAMDDHIMELDLGPAP
jgi:GNAT superfamily N-acetyltransferase